MTTDFIIDIGIYVCVTEKEIERERKKWPRLKINFVCRVVSIE